jgi:cytochrome b561
MSHDGAPQASPGEDALSGTPEPWERWETSLVLISLGLGLFALLLLGWLVDRFILS